jgi:phosphatidylinositol dimannoside acyltransferase
MGPDSLFFRRAAHFGAARAPLWFARYAPAPIAILMAPFLVRARRAIVAQQRLIYGRRGRLTEFWGATKTLIQYASCLSESLGASRVGAPPPDVQVRGAEGLGSLMSSATGIVVATAHIGPWEGAAAALAEGADRSVLLVMEEERDPNASRFEDALRQARGMGVMRLGQSPLAALPVLEHLAQGGVAAMQIDRPTRAGAWMNAELLGRPVRVPEGPFRLALLADVPILPVFAARLGYMRRLVVIGRPIWPLVDRSLPRRQRLLGLAAQVLEQLEAHLREFPTQWFHFVPGEGMGAEEEPAGLLGPGAAQAGSPARSPTSSPTKVA